MRRVGVYTAIGVGLLFVMGFVFARSVKAPEAPVDSSVLLKQFEDKTHGVSLSYPDAAVLYRLSDRDKADKFIFIANSYGAKPYKLYLKYEDGLQAATLVAKVSVLDFMLENLNKLYPKQYPNYSKISEKRFHLAGKEAAEVVFTYISSTEIIKQKILLITKNNEKAFYLSLQTKEADYDALQNEFQKVEESIQIK